MRSRTRISIWFFIGLSLLVNGALILAAGLYELANPPQYRVTLYHLHASIWWGGLLFLLGIFYSYHFAPDHPGETEASSLQARRGDTHAQH